MLVVQNNQKKVNGVDFSECFYSLSGFEFKGNFSHSKFSGATSSASAKIFITEGNYDMCDFSNMNFSYVELKLYGPPVLPNSRSFKGATFAGAVNFGFASKAEFIAYFGVDSVNENTIWIDGTSILS